MLDFSEYVNDVRSFGIAWFGNDRMKVGAGILIMVVKYDFELQNMYLVALFGIVDKVFDKLCMQFSCFAWLRCNVYNFKKIYVYYFKSWST